MVIPKPEKDEVLVVPLEFLLQADVNMHSGGQFLKNIEWFLDEYEKGHVVMASVRRQRDRKFRLDLKVGNYSNYQSYLGHYVKARAQCKVVKAGSKNRPQDAA